MRFSPVKGYCYVLLYCKSKTGTIPLPTLDRSCFLLCFPAFPPLVAKDPWFRPIAQIVAHQQIFVICHNAIAALASRHFDLVAQIDFVIFQQLDPLSIGQGVF